MAVGSSNDFDLVVLGAGTGGYTAAFRAAQLGLQVALVDEDKIGGTCLHRGCIPTKALLESAGFVEQPATRRNSASSWPESPAIDYVQMAAREDQVVKRMWTGLKTLDRQEQGHAGSPGRGRLDGPNRIRVSQPGEDGTPGKGGERILQATDVILATGSRVKSLPGLTPDGEPDHHERRRPGRDEHPQGHRDRRCRRRRRRVRVDVPRPRHEGDAARIPAARSSRSRIARSARRWSAASVGAGSR